MNHPRPQWLAGSRRPDRHARPRYTDARRGSALGAWPTAAVALVLGLGAAAWLVAVGSSRASTAASGPLPVVQFVNQRPGVAYVGARACASCHREEYDAYSGHSMAVSFSPLAASRPPAGDWESDAVVVDPASGFRYEPVKEGGRFFIRETLRDASGKEIHSLSREAHYVLGSGEASQTYVQEENGFLRMLPLSWYADQERWDFAPFFDVENKRFSQLVGPRCLGCHNDVVDFESEDAARVSLPLPEGIGCERCHGPGSAHVDVRRAGVEVVGEVDSTIVNPRHLPGARQIDICAQCHLEGEASVLRPGETEFSFRPGTDLASHRAIFLSAGASSDTTEFGFKRAVERLVLSRCFSESGGVMTCTTCHDPHRSSIGRPAADWDAACMTCHVAGDCSRPENGGVPGSCSGCHMRRSAPFDMPHVLATDHWIRRRIEPPAAPGGGVRRAASELELFRLPGEERPSSEEDLELIAIASADVGLMSAARTALLTVADARRGREALESEPMEGERLVIPSDGVATLNAATLAVGDRELAQAAVFLEDPRALSVAAELLYAVGDSAAARITLERAVVGYGGSPRVTGELARIDAAMGDLAAATTLIGEAIEKDQDDPELRRLQADFTTMKADADLLPEDQLAELRLAVGQYRRALDIDPHNLPALAGFGRTLLRSGNLRLAAPTLSQLTVELPFDVDGHTMLGYCLSALGRPARAVESYERALLLAPGSATLHYNLANAAAAAGDTARAVAGYREAIRLEPGYYQAHGNLGLILRARGDRTGARQAFERVLELRPDDELARRNLEELAR